MENSSVIYDSKRGLHEPTVRRDWFPLVRLITVAAVILLGLHLIPSWQAAVGDVSALPVRLLEGFTRSSGSDRSNLLHQGPRRSWNSVKSSVGAANSSGLPGNRAPLAILRF